MVERERSEEGWIMEDSIKLALIAFKDLHWKPVKCTECGKAENVKQVEIWCDPYCETCLDRILREDEGELFDSISEPDVEY